MRPLENASHRFRESGRKVMKKSLSGVALICLLLCVAPSAGEQVDEQVVASIEMEGFQNSQVMDIAFYLTEVHGPRLSGTPSLEAAAEWSRDRLAEWGLDNAHLESWEVAFAGWNLESYSAELLEDENSAIGDEFPQRLQEILDESLAIFEEKDAEVEADLDSTVVPIRKLASVQLVTAL
jgi:hypothetical protein